MAKKMGRPQIEIDKKTFESLCGIQCSKEEICSVVGVSDSTLSRWVARTYPKVKDEKTGKLKNETFEGIYKKKSALGKTSLRRTLFKLAEKNASVAIFLAKNILGMSDQQIITVSDKDDSVKAMGDYFADKKRNT